MTFVSEIAEIYICTDIVREGNNNITGKQYDDFCRDYGGSLTFFENKVYDLKPYIKAASDEIGNKARVGPNEKVIMQKYTEQAIEDIKSGKLKPIKLPT